MKFGLVEDSGGYVHFSDMKHISDHDLERYHLGMVRHGAELASIEQHYLACSKCAERAEEVAQYVDTLRAAIVEGTYDLG